MKNSNTNVFLTKITERIKNGDFDTYLTFPLMTRELLHSSIKSKINRKIETGGTAVLNDAEVKDCLAEVKETSTYIIAIYLKLGFIEKKGDSFEITHLGKVAIRAMQTQKI